MKKVALVGVLALSAALTLAGCVTTETSSTVGGTSDTTSSTTSSSTSETPAVYKVTKGDTQGVEFTLSAMEAKAGDRIDITVVSVPDDKTLEGFISNVESVVISSRNPTTYSFLMPASDITITPVLKDKAQSTYSLTIQNNAGAEIVTIMDVNANEYQADESGAYHLAPNALYMARLSGGYFTVTVDGVLASFDTEYYSFVMPEKNAVMVIDEQVRYNVNFECNQPEALDGDSIFMVDLDSSSQITGGVLPGQYVGLMITPVLGFELLNVTSSDVTISSIDGGYAFTMPAKNITINIETTGAQVETYSFSAEYGDAFKLNYYTSPTLSYESAVYPYGSEFKSGTTIYFTVELLPVYEGTVVFEKVLVNNQEVTATDGVYSFTFTDSDVLIKVVYQDVYFKLAFDDTNAEGVTCAFYNNVGNPITEAKLNEYITARFTVPAGKIITAIYKNGVEPFDYALENNQYSFYMGKEDLTLSVDVEDLVPHALSSTVTGTESPLTVTFFKDVETKTPITEASYQDKVYVSISGVPEGYFIDSVTLGDTELSEEVIGNETLYSFTMPNSEAQIAINVLPNSERVYAITIDASLDGYYVDQMESLTGWEIIYPMGAKAGETVYLSVQTNAWGGPTAPVKEVFANGVLCTYDAEYELYTFTMPAADVLITATFEELETYSLNITNNTDAEITVMDTRGMYLDLSAIVPGTYIYVNIYSETTTDFVVTLNGETLEYSPLNMGVNFQMPAQDSELIISSASSGDVPTDSYKLMVTNNTEAEVTLFEMPNMSDVNLNAVKAGTQIYVNVYSDDSISPLVTLNGEALEYDADNFGYLFTMPAQDSELVISIK